MKTLVLLIFICTNNLAQQDSIKKIFEDDTIIEIFPEKPVQLIGGLDSLKYRLRYPLKAIEKGIEGNVVVQITIDSLGNPSHPHILKSLGFGCDEEAIRVLLTSKYHPAVLKGRKVKSKCSIIVKFKLPK